ncbi:MAG: putative FMN-dependent luciferase-like monooxygenase, partial [Bradyrhizobium sp.]|nr:putative FMN-dependent luciferase-like monooxygenase [Bradyrhizobium sp.]
LQDVIKALDVHVGTPDDVIETLRADSVLARATDLVFQVHSVDPPHPHTLRSIELTAAHVAPALGWVNRHTPAKPLLASVG